MLEASMGCNRQIMIAVDDGDASQVMVQWILDSDRLLPDDKVHLLHVAIRDMFGGNLPGADYFEQAHPQQAQQQVLAMLQQRFLGNLQQNGIRAVVHIVQASQDSKTVGRIICTKAEDLKCNHVYVAAYSHHQSKLCRILEGPPVEEYVRKHCKVPVTFVAKAADGAVVSEFQQGNAEQQKHK